MGNALFYHLTDSPIEATLPMLLGKARGAGWRVVVRGTDAERLDWLDQKLWLGREEDFLAHGLSGANDALQPILLTLSADLPNDPACLMSIDGAAVSAKEAKTLDRVCVLFDGHDEAAVNIARGQWKDLTSAGITGQYWAQEGGRWVMKTESS